MMISKSCEHGIRAALLLAATEGGEEYTSIGTLSDGLGISYHFLTKTLQKLTEHGLLRSYRGPRGGIALARPAEDISIKDIIVAIDGPDLFERCVLGLPACGTAAPCPMHDQWSTVRDALEQQFETNTLGWLSESAKNSEVRLTTDKLLDDLAGDS